MAKKCLHGLRRGIYRTEYGNAAYVAGPSAKTAFDLDFCEHIPVEAVTNEFIRKAEPSDRLLKHQNT